MPMSACSSSPPSSPRRTSSRNAGSPCRCCCSTRSRSSARAGSSRSRSRPEPMHDIRAIRADPAGFDAALARRGLQPVSPELVEKDAAHRATLTALQEMQSRRNALSRQVGEGRRAKADTTALEAEAGALRADMERLERQADNLQSELRLLLDCLPNLLDPEVPDGPDESANVELSRHGEPREFDFPPRQHFELGEALGLM